MDLIGFMGGNCTDVLTKLTTHLVVSSVMSEKYFVSSLNFSRTEISQLVNVLIILHTPERHFD